MFRHACVWEPAGCLRAGERAPVCLYGHKTVASITRQMFAIVHRISHEAFQSEDLAGLHPARHSGEMTSNLDLCLIVTGFCCFCFKEETSVVCVSLNL